MAEIQLTKNKKVFNYCEPYIIAEIGANHNGDMELAKKLIDNAKQAGADCVKFQSWTKDSIFSRKTYNENYFLNDDYRQRKDFNLESIVDEFSLSEKELFEIKNYCDKKPIDFASTPFSPREVDFLVDQLKAPFIKIASMDLNNYPFLEYIAKKGKPMVLSTGLSYLHEIDKAVQTIKNTGNNQLVLLHCVSIYPPDDKEVNLNNIATYQKLYNYPVGFSDHTLGYSISLASVALGACLIEKHFTLDKEMFGWDHKVSANAEELEIIVKESKRIVEALGSFEIICSENEERKTAFRRSIVSARKIIKGETISFEDLNFKRPGTGIEPGDYTFIVGRTAKHDIEFDQIITLDDIC